MESCAKQLENALVLLMVRIAASSLSWGCEWSYGLPTTPRVLYFPALYRSLGTRQLQLTPDNSNLHGK